MLATVYVTFEAVFPNSDLVVACGRIAYLRPSALPLHAKAAAKGCFLVQDASTLARRTIKVLRHAGAGPDHSMVPGYPEGAYLTNMLLHVS